MAHATLKFSSLQRIPHTATGAVSCVPIPEFPNSSSQKININAMKKGTGGRSSFNGVVATVFGSSGFLGSFVCNQLGKIGTQLILPYRGAADEMRPRKLAGDLGQVLFLPFNLRDEASIRKSLMYSNTVINLIGCDWETKNYTFDGVHVEGARRIARIAREEGIDNFIHVSALNASEHPQPYLLSTGSKWLASKWAGENAVREEFPDAVIIRPSDIYGAEDKFLRYFCSNWRHNFKLLPLYEKVETTEVQPVYVADVAAGIVAACRDRTAKGEVFQAVGPHRYLLSDLVDWFHDIMRRGKGTGYMRYDIKYDPIFQMRFTILPLLSLGAPIANIHWERLEREIHSDRVNKKMKTLEDLGVSLTKMEEQVPWELRTYKSQAYYDEELGEFEQPDNPKVINVKNSKKTQLAWLENYTRMNVF